MKQEKSMLRILELRFEWYEERGKKKEAKMGLKFLAQMIG